MKAITIWQPWASLLIAGIKPVENRTWKPSLNIGDRVAIHAGKDQADVEEWVLDEILKSGRKDNWVNGCIIGTMVYRGVITKASELTPDKHKWFSGPIGWLLNEPEEWKTPFSCKGKLGLWEVSTECLNTR